MNIHVTTGRWKLGLFLSLITASLWGILPIALKVLLNQMDAITIIWYRFLIASAILVVYVTLKKGLPSISRMRGSILYLLIAAGIGLSGNYFFYVVGLDYLSPSTATVVIQLAPVFMLLGSLVLFKERFSVRQWAGFAILMTGMFLFFNDRLNDLVSRLNDYSFGVLLITASAVIWAVYALSQKQLLKTFSSETIMFCIYITGSVFFLPFARPAGILKLDTVHFILLVFCAINTLIAYGSFAEALDHWEASRISMVLAIIPLITVAAVRICSFLFPRYIMPEHLNALSLVGTCFVVTGSMLCVLGDNGKMKPL